MNTYNVAITGDPRAFFDALTKAGISYETASILTGINVVCIETSVSKEAIQALEMVVVVEDNQTVDLISHASWQLQRLSTTMLPMPQTPLPTNGGIGQTVYLLDTNVDTSHPEFSDADVRILGTTNHPPKDHGTAMASLIVGKTLGTAPKASLRVVPLPLGESGIPLSVILTALDTVLSDTERPATSVMLCAWGIPKSEIVDLKITELQNAGVVVVAAAGNTLSAADTISPVGLDTVLGVGATDAFDRVISWAPGQGSNWGPEVDLCAPGIDITVACTNNSTEVWSGTSCAAAIAAGVVAQYLVKYPDRTAADIRDIVVANAVPDILFRNETIYETTPNLLIQQVKTTANEFWDYTAPDTGLFYVKKGSTKTIAIEKKGKTAHITAVKIQNGAVQIVPFFWTSVVDNGQTVNLSITPPNNLSVGKYIIILSATDENNNLLAHLWLRIGVFESSETELDTITTELYLTKLTETSPVTITPYTDCCVTGCPKDTICCSSTGEPGTTSCMFVPTGFCC